MYSDVTYNGVHRNTDSKLAKTLIQKTVKRNSFDTLTYSILYKSLIKAQKISTENNEQNDKKNYFIKIKDQVNLKKGFFFVTFLNDLLFFFLRNRATH